VITHIVTDAQERPTLRALGLKRLSDIPNHVPTVKWDWIAQAIGRTPVMSKDGVLRVRMDELFMHAAFSERIDAGREPMPSSSKRKGKEKAPANEDISHISYVLNHSRSYPQASDHHSRDFTQDRPRRQSNARSIHDSADEDEEGELAYSSTGAPPSPPTSPYRPLKFGQPSSTRSLDVQHKVQPDDPLAEFYAKARAERDSGVMPFRPPM
jgi:DNA polymerase lambda